MSERRRSKRNLDKYYFGHYFESHVLNSDEDSSYEDQRLPTNIDRGLRFEENVSDYLGKTIKLVLLQY